MKYLIAALFGIAVFMAIDAINENQQEKRIKALLVIDGCPSFGTVFVELSTPLFGSGLKVSCMYQNTIPPILELQEDKS